MQGMIEKHKEEFEKLLKNYPAKRAALLPVLHVIQAEQGFISRDDEINVAEYLGISPVQVEEVISFYSLFTKEKVGKYNVSVCKNVSCNLEGSEKVVEAFEKELHLKEGKTTSNGKFRLNCVACLGSCGTGPVVRINNDYYEKVTGERLTRLVECLKNDDAENLKKLRIGLLDFFRQDDDGTPRIVTKHLFGGGNTNKIETYMKSGGYDALKKAVTMKPEEIIEEVKKSSLRGRGGAGFPAGVKWGFLPKDLSKPRYMCVNADEGEPGTFKDRYIMERDPHLFIEGIIIGCYACRINTAYIYIRGEYAESYENVRSALNEAHEKGFLGKNILNSGFNLDVYMHQGAGAYICGEETGLIESLEGKRGMPRPKPPFPAIEGLFGCPTIVNNVETLAFVPDIILKGAEWFAGMGTPKNGGTRIFCVSGHVQRPGIYELPMGTPLRDIIYKHAGGMRNGKKPKMIIPGGASATPLSADEMDTPMDFDALMKAGSMGGSGGVIVMDEDTCAVEVLDNLMEFYHEESCGQCTPCREGSMWLHVIVRNILKGKMQSEQIDYALNLINHIAGGKTICAMGEAVAMPVRGFLKKFRGDFEAHIKNSGVCPYEKKVKVEV